MSQGGEKTEQPTAKRLREARKRGQIAKSQDLTSAVLFVAAILVLWLAGDFMVGHLAALMRDSLTRAAAEGGKLDGAFALRRLNDGVLSMAFALAPFLLTLFVAGGLVAYLQVGSIFAFESIKPNLEKIDLAKNFQQKFLKSRSYIELGKTIVKLVVAAVVAASVLWGARLDLIRLTHAPLAAIAGFTTTIVFEIGVKVGVAFLLLGALDWFLQRFLHSKEMRMTKQEVKEEHKETEGNPHVKSARRQMHRQIMMESMMAAVRRADVVVVNPTHIAVALRYDRETMGAPQIVAKGAELMAAKMREIARAAEIPVMRDVPLARAMYELEIDDEVPEELYESIAVVLRWAYDLAKERGESGQAEAKSMKPDGRSEAANHA